MQVLVPRCCFCEKVRDDDGTDVGQGRWIDHKTYYTKHNLLPDDVWFSHTCCPDCRWRSWTVRTAG